MDKRRLLKTLEELQLDDLMTIGELKVSLNKRINDEQEQRVKKDEAIVSKYKGKYLVKFDSNGIFGGTEIEFIHVEDIKAQTYNTNGGREFEIIGWYFTFSVIGGSGVRKFSDGHVNSLRSEKDLELYKIITKETYDNYMEKAITRDMELKSILDTTKEKIQADDK